MEWLTNSVFCLQPPGDSPSRKSFYDSIMAGCIPVIFETPGVGHIIYPFENVLDYSTFSVKIPANKKFLYVLEQYAKDDDKVRALQKGMFKVIKYLQYSYAVTTGPHDDAIQLVMDELGDHIARGSNSSRHIGAS